MINSQVMLEKELETAIALAKKAGAIILDFYANGCEVEEKIFDDNFSEPVTIADRTASRIIVENLAESFPRDGILSEEEFDDKARLDKERVWIIDPLDGTSGFIEKTGDFAVQIGLAENGKAVLGVVFMPLQDILYFAVKNGGAFVVENDAAPELLHVSGKIDLAEMLLASSRHHRSPRMSQVFKKFGLKSEVQRGSVGLKVGLIAQQRADLYIHLSPRTKHWDTCAPEIILREAGGEMTDLFGEKIIYNTPDVHNHNGVLATNGAAHAAAVNNLKTLLAEFGRLRIV
ncbi:MAG: 3'(2'),5'-bisphosphate nucleotidase CysQ [Pyrinomonadaceae bacterium]|nr:3'(2'),5'-bisphosphate nucleotidase CysQ [Pyrinomonadaceae bacterium]